MKKFHIIGLILLAALMLTALIGCEKEAGDKPIDGLLEIMPQYIGETVTDTTHEFKKSDFKVLAVFTNNITKEVTDYTFEQDGMIYGSYVIHFSYGGVENDLYVECDMNFFPSDGE